MAGFSERLASDLGTLDAQVLHGATQAFDEMQRDIHDTLTWTRNAGSKGDPFAVVAGAFALAGEVALAANLAVIGAVGIGALAQVEMDLLAAAAIVDLAGGMSAPPPR